MAPADNTDMRRVLVIAYYFPPMGLSGVQRVAKFVKYLPQHGWKPTVLTVRPGGYYAFDPSLSEEIETADVEVVRTRSLDPTQLFGRRTSIEMPAATRRKWWRRFTQLIFVPDNKIGWFPLAYRRGQRLLRNGSFDAIFATAPPYTSLLIGSALSRRSGTPLVVDYRDDWIGSTHHGYPTPLHRRMHERLEARVLRQSSRVVTINSYIQEALERRHPEQGEIMSVIPHGFDPQDFDSQDFGDIAGEVADGSSERETGAETHKKMTFLYSGIFYDAQQPDTFLRALAGLFDRLGETRSSVTAEFVGHVPGHTRSLIRQLGIADNVRLHGYLPHGDTVQLLRGADVLWMTVGHQEGEKQISTSKLFEYFGARRTVLGLVPRGAAYDAIADYSAGVAAPPEDVEAVTDALEALYRKWKGGSLPIPDEQNVRPFNRQLLAAHLADQLTESVQNGMRAWR